MTTKDSTTEKKHRAMTMKTFIKGANAPRVSAQAYLEAHAEFLASNELAPITSPIIEKVKNRDIMPTPALAQIQQVVFDYMMQVDKAKADYSLANPSKGGRSAGQKSQTSVIYSKDGEILTRVDEETGEVKDLIANHDLFQDAQGWCDRRLDECEPDSYAVITSNKLITPKGVFTTHIKRNESIARLARRMGHNTVMKSSPKSTSRLSFGVKCNPSKSTFSGG